ncbi:unnamed protein product [Caenorhabditis sp. 36 PRJEB53466]|nr:unnamed protein product [Caenorhabditis sp. 36 PRJEB53466]
MKTCLCSLLFVFLLLNAITATRSDVCDELKCGTDQVCDREAVECVNKKDMTEGRPCQAHEDCRDDHICYDNHCIFFIGRHK